MLKRILTSLLAIVVSGSMLTGCSGSDKEQSGTASSNQSGEQVTLTFWKAPHSNKEAENWAPIIQDFENENPNIKVEFLVTPWETWTEQYTTAFASNVPPDVSYMTEGYPMLAEEGYLEDLSAYIDVEDIKKLYGGENGIYNEKIAGMPFLTLATVLYYNVDILENAGINVPTTWDELREAAKKLTVDENGDGNPEQWGLFMKLGQWAPNIDTCFIMQGGADGILNSDITGIGFNNEAGYVGLQFLHDLMWEDKCIPDLDIINSPESESFFPSGKAAMVMGDSNLIANYLEKNPDLNYGSATVPAGPAGKQNFSNCGFLSMASASKYKDEAWKFIEFVCRPEQASRYLAPTGFLGCNAETDALIIKESPLLEAAVEAKEDGYSFPTIPEFQTVVYPALEDLTEAVYRNEKSVPEAVSECEKAIESGLN